jgi:hypothetical protein
MGGISDRINRFLQQLWKYASSFSPTQASGITRVSGKNKTAAPARDAAVGKIV